MKTHDEMIADWMKDPEFKAEYDAQEEEFALLDECIKARKRSGLAQTEITAGMGTKAPAVARIEACGGSKRHSPSIATLRRYAEAVGFPTHLGLTRLSGRIRDGELTLQQQETDSPTIPVFTEISRRSTMALSNDYLTKEPTRPEIDALTAPTVLEFGTAWCGYCQAAQPFIAAAFADFPQVSHIKVEDGRGRPLGRSFGVKLWPTLVFLKDGKEVARLVRPQAAAEIVGALRQIGQAGNP